MFEVRKEQNERERAFLIGVGTKGETEKVINEQMDELSLLADTAGAWIIGRAFQIRHAPDPKFYIGSGRARTINETIRGNGVDVVIFNDDLSPSQQRNLENLFKTKTIDRSMLILDIFARHARTYESKIQVELAQISYLASRLTGMWTHFSQQTGGIGTRGPGEKQLEVDRRIVKKRISDLKKKLENIETQRHQQKKRRSAIFKTCLVGYTNVGKSTILNSMSSARVPTENKLFATLDATTKRIYIPGHGEILLSDTVGFIRKLPHHLVASFRSTLEVITDADLIVCVMDVSSESLGEQMEVVNQVLNDLRTENIKRLLLFNKTDQADNPVFIKRLQNEYPEAVFMSALKKSGLENFKKAVYTAIGNS
jgi:GTP-binding protein HflX